MRLRSSQFVFLLLLACSVQVGEGYAFGLIAGQVLNTAPSPDALAVAQPQRPRTIAVAKRPAPVLDLSPQASAAERAPRFMSHPASASAAVASFTGLLRA